MKMCIYFEKYYHGEVISRVRIDLRTYTGVTTRLTSLSRSRKGKIEIRKIHF